ncbi:MAG TPA: hypothetical protein VKT75_11565 [Acidobacteriaceae bacterium]|nr:hypothetical protein [Acidobacteriaceae bacterium]
MSSTTQPVASSPRWKWSDRVFSLPAILIVALVYVTSLYAYQLRVGDPDIWWHLRNASQLIHTRHFIHTDFLTFTVAGKPWINFEWLGELPYYFAWQSLGLTGLYLVELILASSIAVGIYCLCWMRCRSPLAAFLSSAVAVLFATVSFAPRTLLFGWLFVVMEIAILWSFQERRDYTWWLPLLFLVWINTHGSWFIGFALMLVFIACGFADFCCGNVDATRWSLAEKKKLLAVTAATIGAVFANPYGWRLVTYPFDVAFQQKLTIQDVAEWASLDFHTIRGRVVLMLILLMGTLQLVRERRWKLQDLAFAAIGIYAGVTYIRFLFLTGILIAPLLALQLDFLFGEPSPQRKNRPWANAAVIAVLLVLIAARFPTRTQLDADIAQGFPVKALPYLRSISGNGRIFNPHEWGGYLEWYTQAPQFIDTRNDIFVHEGTMQDYVRVVQANGAFEVFSNYQIRYVLLADGSSTAYLLRHSPEWKQTYDDGQAAVFERSR